MITPLDTHVPRSLAALRPIFFGLPILLCQFVNAQSLTVRGQVDARHLALPTVRVTASQSGKEAITDKAGKFTLFVFSQDTLTLAHPNFPTRRYVLPLLEGDISLYFDMVDTSRFWVNNTAHTRGTVRSTLPPENWDQKAIPTFPWPVPPPSAKAVLDTRFFANVKTLAQADRRLTDALQKSGYPGPSYYQAPRGFALVGQIEQIDADGTPKQPPARWSAQVEPYRQFSLGNYLMLLFTAATGRFRIIVFLVTDVPAEKDTKAIVTPDAAKAWYKNGVDFLPSDIGRLPFTDSYRVTALIYEFEKPENSKAQQLNSSACLGQDHLSKSRITANLIK